MPYIVIWTEGALEDLARHYAFMAEEDVELGLKAVEAIEEGTLLLERFPNAGRPPLIWSRSRKSCSYPLAHPATYCSTRLKAKKCLSLLFAISEKLVINKAITLREVFNLQTLSQKGGQYE